MSRITKTNNKNGAIHGILCWLCCLGSGYVFAQAALADTQLQVTAGTFHDFSPYQTERYSVWAPANWSFQQYSQGDLAMSPGFMPSETAPDLLVFRQLTNKPVQTSKVIDEFQKTLAAKLGGTFRQVFEERLSTHAYLRILDLFAKTTKARVALMALQDKQGLNVGFYATPPQHFESYGGADLLSIVLGSLRLKDEEPVLEVRRNIGVHDVAISQLGVDVRLQDRYERLLEFALDHNLSNQERSVIRLANYIELKALPKSQREPQWRKTQMLVDAFEQQLQKMNNAVRPHARWLLQNALLGIIRQDPSSPGAPMLLKLFYQFRLSYLPKNVASMPELSPLDAYNQRDAAASIQINIAKWRRVELVHTLWKKITAAFPQDAEYMLKGLQQELVLAAPLKTSYIVASATNKGEQTIAAVGDIDAAELLAFIQGEAKWQKRQDIYYGTLPGQQEPVNLKIEPWGYITGKSVTLGAHRDTTHHVTVDDIPMLRVHLFNEMLTAQIGRRGTDSETGLRYAAELTMDLNKSLRVNKTLFFPDPDIARAYLAVSHIMYSVPATGQAGIDVLPYTTWEVIGNAVIEKLDLPSDKSRELVSNWANGVIANIKSAKEQAQKNEIRNLENQILMNQMMMVFMTNYSFSSAMARSSMRTSMDMSIRHGKQYTSSFSNVWTHRVGIDNLRW